MAGLMASYTFAEFVQKARAGAFTPGGGSVATPVAPETGRTIAQILVSDVKKRFATGTAPDGSPWRPLKYPRPNGGDKPLRDTGVLMASITAKVDRTGVTVGTTHPGAALQNAGGTVRPKRGKFLAIPLTREAKRAGSPRRMKGTKELPLFARWNASGQPVGHFLLVRKAVIPKREFVGVSKEAERAIGQVLLDAAALDWERMR